MDKIDVEAIEAETAKIKEETAKIRIKMYLFDFMSFYYSCLNN